MPVDLKAVPSNDDKQERPLEPFENRKVRDVLKERDHRKWLKQNFNGILRWLGIFGGVWVFFKLAAHDIATLFK